jgi:hypothetical protein
MILLDILKERNISKLQLALKCEIACSDLYNAINSNRPFYPKWRKSISNFLGVDEELIFDGNKLRKKKENLKIIRFNDDNHAERIWVNGKFIGTASNMDDVFLKFWEVCKEKQWSGVESTSIWVCDDFDDIDEDTVDEIWDWFNEVEQMTPSQRLAVESKNWEWLIDLI